MLQSLVLVREDFFHSFALKKAFHNLGRIKSGFHVEVNEGFIRIIKASWIIFFKFIYHFLNDPFWSEDLVIFLRRDVVEDIALDLLIKVIAEFLLLYEKASNGIIEDNRIKDISFEVSGFTCLFIDIVPAIAKETELIQSDAVDLVLMVHPLNL